MTPASFVGVDWGTSSFRLWALTDHGHILAASRGPYGMAQLKKDDYASVLNNSLDDLGVDASVPVIICGMAGAAQGWHEAPYCSAPAHLHQLGVDAVRVPGVNRDVRILPGVKQQHPANVMRGEETQIAGLLHSHPDFSGTVCMPGTHTKWVTIQNQSIVDFETCMTGEQFALLSSQSVLSHSMSSTEWDDNAFLDGVRETLAQSDAVARRLFSIRAETLVGTQTAAQARARLSGLLIGQELAATRPYWRDQCVTLIGEPDLCALYAIAFASCDARSHTMTGESMTIAGLVSAYTVNKDTTGD
ncbi:2-dehydro-3-deoxygalactonokinase [Litorivicinus lipolyticus]|uniref:2-dehydro-3-deoxygalactonokinase n=1 Tax=Litorivicinus lipolyticus TaxID=418701 RepID=UPI003B5A3E9B